MNLHQLRLFCAVVECGSFSLAAQTLYISQPAVSIQIKRLQRTVGQPLLQVGRDGIVLTDAGRILYESARIMLEQERVMKGRLAELQAGKGGTLSIGVSPTGALYRVAEAIKCFRALYPSVEVRLHVELAESILTHLRSGTIEMAVEWEPVPREGFDLTPVDHVDFGVIIASDDPLAAQRSLAQEDFKRLPYLALQYGPGVPGFVELALLRAGLLPPVAMRFPGIDALKRAVEAGLGVTVLSLFSVERELRAGHLKWLTLDGFTLRRSMVRLLARGHRESRYVEALTRILLNHRRTP